MRVSAPVQFAKGMLNIGIDPRVLPPLIFGGACRDHARKHGIRRHTEPVLSYGFGQRLGQFKPIQRQNRSHFRLDPKCIGVIARIGHGEDAACIGPHQQIEIDGQNAVLFRIGVNVRKGH